MVRFYIIHLFISLFLVSCKTKDTEIKNQKRLAAKVDSMLLYNFFYPGDYVMLISSSEQNPNIYLKKESSLLDSLTFAGNRSFSCFNAKFYWQGIYFKLSQDVEKPSVSGIIEGLKDKIHFSYLGTGDYYYKTPCLSANKHDTLPYVSWHKITESIIGVPTFDEDFRNFKKIKMLQVETFKDCSHKIQTTHRERLLTYDTLEHVYYTKKIKAKVSLVPVSKAGVKGALFEVKGTFNVIDGEFGSQRLFYKGKWYYRSKQDNDFYELSSL